MYAFEYKNPSTLSEAAQMLQDSDDAMLLAGGHTLLPDHEAGDSPLQGT